MLTPETWGYAFIGGLLPPLIWLYFLLKEDVKHHEPKELIALAFVAGMLAVPLALPFEHFAQLHWGSGTNTVLLAWAAIEEVLKYSMAAIFILWRSSVDDAPDYVIYLFTTALGFAAAENMLFLLTPISEGGIIAGLVTDNLRFVGSTLLHVVASSAIGFALAFSWQKSPGMRMIAAAAGLILATGLHAAFNALIITGEGSRAFFAFFLVWSGAVAFFAAFEILKYFDYKHPTPNPIG